MDNNRDSTAVIPCDNPIPWYKRKEFWGTVITVISFTPEVLQLFPEQTLAFKLALPVGIILTALGLRKGYKANNLWQWITNIMHRIPDKITGKFNSFGKIGHKW